MDGSCQFVGYFLVFAVSDFVFDHAAASLGDLRCVGRLVVLVKLRFLQLFDSSVLVCDLVFHELVEFAGPLLSTLPLHHLGLHEDLLVFLALTLLLCLLITLLLLNSLM